MTLAGLAWRYLWARPLVALLNLLLLALGSAAMVFLLLVAEQVEAAVQRDLAGIDLVVGAKGSPLQLILAGVFHLDVPSGNIPLATLQTLRAQPLVAQAVPLSLGDAFQGHRIVGTEPEYMAMYGATLAQGRPWQKPLEAVIGHDVAPGLVPGQTFHGSHGLGEAGQDHADSAYTVVGRLAQCGCVLDRLVLTGLESVWQVHEAHHDAAATDQEPEAREITLVLLRYRSPLAAVSLPRWVNAQPMLQAAAPALESARLLRIVGVGSELLRGFALMLVLVAGLSVFVALTHAVREREPDLAMMRMLGAPPRRVAALVALEAVWLVLLGGLAGSVLGHGLAHLLGSVLARQRSLALTGAWWSVSEAWLALGLLGLALLSAAWPAWRALRLDVARLLQSPG